MAAMPIPKAATIKNRFREVGRSLGRSSLAPALGSGLDTTPIRDFLDGGESGCCTKLAFVSSESPKLELKC